MLFELKASSKIINYICKLQLSKYFAVCRQYWSPSFNIKRIRENPETNWLGAALHFLQKLLNSYRKFVHCKQNQTAFFAK